MIEQHPLTAAIAQDLAAHLPLSEAPPMHELCGIASLAAALTTFGAAIQAKGCDTGQAHAFAQIRTRLRDCLAELGSATAGSAAAEILANATTLSDGLLILMPPAGNA